MRSEFLFFLAMLVIFFVLWLAGGGPSKPISFAGPYITPITNVDQTQVGYGEGGWISGIRVNGSLPGIRQQQIQGELSSAQNRLSDLQQQVKEVQLFGSPSPYKGQVRISGGNFTATDPDQEYVTIQVQNSAPGDITITGWRLVSAATGYGAIIGTGTEVPTPGWVPSNVPIVLRPGDRVYVTTGESPVGSSFKENICSGYLGYTQNFYPPVANRCPSAAEEFKKYFEGNALQDSGCYTRTKNAGSCEVPSDAAPISSYCLSLIDKRLTYNGCVATHRYDARFFTGTWRVFLNRGEITRTHTNKSEYGELWRSSREGVKLLDENGLTVDLYTY
tara:strand:- start:500695 stop:501693 length:999 start_codon:yes stop_codon:yes gene_type:complete